jgi:hypothetical protein
VLTALASWQRAIPVSVRVRELQWPCIEDDHANLVMERLGGDGLREDHCEGEARPSHWLA